MEAAPYRIEFLVWSGKAYSNDTISIYSTALFAVF